MTQALFSRFFADDTGATAIEYALIASIIVTAIVGAVSALGTATSENFQETADGFPT